MDKVSYARMAEMRLLRPSDLYYRELMHQNTKLHHLLC